MNDRPTLLIRNHFELLDVAEQMGLSVALVERDFALMLIAARLVAEHPGRLCFKGGFVLRHVYGHERFSKDIDTTRTNPPKNKLDADEIAETIRRAGMKNLLTLDPGVPATDSGTSLDFASVGYRGPLGEGSVAVEVSYREAVVEPPELVDVGPPYYESFTIPVMALDEIVAEKLRTLAQRLRPTDLADLAMILDKHDIDERRVRTLAAKKFDLVRGGDRRARIEESVAAMGASYDAVVTAVAPDAPDYGRATELVSKRLGGLLP